MINKYTIVCDESSKKGKNYSYFYGGAMLLESKYEQISSVLDDNKNKLGFHELKRIKITEKNYKDYISMLNLFFEFVKSGDIKVRIMFSPNNQLLRLAKSENFSYTKFYHTFIKNAFNIFYAGKDIGLRLIFDDLPETKEQCDKFKQCLIESINNNDNNKRHYKNKRRYKNNKVYLEQSQIEEVDSKKHIILQLIDVIVGVIDFYLNTDPTEICQSKRASAKYEVYKHVLSQINEIKSNFDICKTTYPIYSNKAWLNKYAHFVYHKK